MLPRASLDMMAVRADTEQTTPRGLRRRLWHRRALYLTTATKAMFYY